MDFDSVTINYGRDARITAIRLCVAVSLACFAIFMAVHGVNCTGVSDRLSA